MKVAAVIPAAGLGTRMARSGAGTSRKQFMLLDGAPILIHTLRKFIACPRVDEIVVSLRHDTTISENDFAPAFLLVGGIAALSTFAFARMPANAGDELTGPRGQK